ncbi:MAG: hypothetical protein QOD73_2477 [Solirubrobacteraceae bacterium]|nr:hypothetical protein [Solirubrobacteraceae bacterium]
MMSTGSPCLMVHPVHAAVASAQFGVPDGYVAPHDSPAAYARAVEAAGGRIAAHDASPVGRRTAPPSDALGAPHEPT